MDPQFQFDNDELDTDTNPDTQFDANDILSDTFTDYDELDHALGNEQGGKDQLTRLWYERNASENRILDAARRMSSSSSLSSSLSSIANGGLHQSPLAARLAVDTEDDRSVSPYPSPSTSAMAMTMAMAKSKSATTANNNNNPSNNTVNNIGNGMNGKRIMTNRTNATSLSLSYMMTQGASHNHTAHKLEHLARAKRVRELRTQRNYAFLQIIKHFKPGQSLEPLEKWLFRGAEVDAITRQGDPAVLALLKKDCLDAASVLLNWNASIDCMDANYVTPLMYACFTLNEGLVMQLLAKNCSLGYQDRYGDTALMYALGHPMSETRDRILTAILEKNIAYLGDQSHALIRLKNRSGQNALMYAARKVTNLNILAMLFQGIHADDLNQQDEYGWTCMMNAAAYGNNAAMSLLAYHGALIDVRNTAGTTALWIAANHNNIDSVELLINLGADVNIPAHTGETMLYHAVKQSHYDIVKRVVTKTRKELMDYEYPGIKETALGLLVTRNIDNPYLVQEFIDQGADIHHVNGHGQTPLMNAARKNHVFTVNTLIKNHVDVNQQSKVTSETALHYAAMSPSSLEAFDALLHLGNADPNLADHDGETPLLYAARIGNVKMIQSLIHHGANIYQRNKCGQTAFQLATQKLHLDAAHVLSVEELERDISTHGSSSIRGGSRYNVGSANTSVHSGSLFGLHHAMSHLHTSSHQVHDRSRYNDFSMHSGFSAYME
eukprot:CAMPEP_0184694424 /NCGR_PEP_ID=MMETSP0313-20130426/2393_1 /TAXON_ID=2792 /ORGANISM="Porphyridium aerugineum, Strain SAG 1380-2" /LENGTH=721 /DNA_ID=CAMNT_0027152717 /DNA_START=262 /DNA_END=2427 /DNA_ORIENTATION=-